MGSQTISHHLGPSQTISDDPRRSRTISDDLRRSLTISDHLRRSNACHFAVHISKGLNAPPSCSSTSRPLRRCSDEMRASSRIRGDVADAGAAPAEALLGLSHRSSK
eukprot:4642508-Pleurochrysis_carterae.AAC.1